MSLNGICKVFFISTGSTPIDLKINQKISTSLKQTYPDKSIRRNYFLAACSLFVVSSDNLNYDTLFKLRPYGGLISIDNSSLEKYLIQNFMIALYFARCGRIYTRVLPRGSHVPLLVAPELQQQLMGLFEWNSFLHFYSVEKTRSLSFTRMLGERSVVLDLEGFRYKKNAFVVKELAIAASDYSD